MLLMQWMLGLLKGARKPFLKSTRPPDSQYLETYLQARTIALEEENRQLSQEISERERLEALLFQEKELAQVTLQSIGDAVITTDSQGRITYLNPPAEKLVGWSLAEAQGIHSDELLKIFHGNTRQPVESPIMRALKEQSIVGLPDNAVLIARDGTEYFIADSAAPICDRNGNLIGAVLVFHDVTASRKLAQQLSWYARHDNLTGLINRHEFESNVEKAIHSAQSDHEEHVLCYLDLDQFKVVNDTCGHPAGDELLRQVSVMLKQRVRAADLTARLGGDEFGLLLKNCGLGQGISIANQIREEVQDFRFIWQDKAFKIGVSIGLVLLTGQTRSYKQVLSAADAACYAAKNAGRNRVQVYYDHDRELARQRGERQWITEITHALDNNRFRLYMPNHRADSTGCWTDS